MIKFEIGFSWYFLLIQLLLHLVSICVVLWLPLIGWIKLPMAAFCLLSLVYVLLHQVLRTRPTSVISFGCDNTGLWHLVKNNGAKEILELKGNSLCTVYFVMLNFKKWKIFQQSLMVFCDAMNQEDFRRLRILAVQGISRN